MAAPLNNNNAGKWTVEDARELCQKALDAISTDCFYMSKVADKVDAYPQLFMYLAEKYGNDEIVFLTIKKMYNRCEAIITEKTGNGDIVPSLGIFILKAYHGLVETSRQQIDHTTQGEKMNVTPLTFFKSENDQDQ